MLLFSTYCSKEKASIPRNLPAIDRYRSDRIQAVFKAATAAGAEFRILSGKYGLLEASTPIPLYDHLLVSEEVPGMTARIAEQLQQIKPSKVVFFSRSVKQDPRVVPYRSTIASACKTKGIELIVVDMTEENISAEDIAGYGAPF